LLKMVVLPCPFFLSAIEPVSVALVKMRLGPLKPDRDVAKRKAVCRYSNRRGPKG
jgi:hypothetical protein